MSRRGRIEVRARLLALLLGLLLVQTVVLVFLVWRSPARVPTSRGVPADPELRRELVTELARESGGDFDSHPDDAVGHVHLVGERNGFHGAERISERGLREVDYVLPKPEGLVRIVILGDSFVFGWRVPAEERMGSWLAAHLRERCADAREIEVLHLGVISWSLTSECAFLRRQLDTLQPDLVIQITVTNDLDDPQGVRGFGTLASFSTRGFGPDNGFLTVNHPRDVLGIMAQDHLNKGWGWDSRRRFEQALEAVQTLQSALEASPGHPRYLLLVHWDVTTPYFHEHLGRFLAPETISYLPLSFWKESSYRLEHDQHWSVPGHQAVARILYGEIVARGLLPELHLAAWPEAEEEARRLTTEGLEEAQIEAKPPRGMTTTLRFASLGERNALQILGGVDGEGLVSPYASVLMPLRGKAGEVHLVGRFLPDRVLAGASIRVWLDEERAGTLTIEPGAVIDSRFPIPEGLRERRAICVRFASDDFVYRGSDLRHCVSFRLEELSVR